MSKNIRIIFFVLLLVFIFFTVQIVKFNSEGEKTFLDKNEPSFKAAGPLGNNYYSYKGDNDLFGVRDAQGNKLTEALWKEIKDSIDDQRFIVLDPDSKKFGIIDINDNIVVPMIYTKFILYDDRYILGVTEKLSGKHGNVLLDMSGNILIDEEWDVCHENGFEKGKKKTAGYLQLNKNKDYCRVKFDDNGNLRMYYIEMRRNFLGRETKITAHPPGNIVPLREAYSVYEEILDRSTEYLTAVFEGDASTIKNLVDTVKYGDNSQKHNAFRGCILKYLGNIQPSVTVDDSAEGKTVYTCSIDALYSVPGDINADGHYLNTDSACNFLIVMEQDSEGKFKIVDLYMNDMDVLELKLPEDFFPDETTVSDASAAPDDTNFPASVTDVSETAVDNTKNEKLKTHNTTSISEINTR